jgi:[ribosomal protein S5]-alanine N-acetyltransferase
MMIVFLETSRLYLYQLTKDFCNENYNTWLHDKEVNRFLDTGDFPLSVSDLETYVEKTHSNTIFLAIVIKESNKHIGNIKIESIDFKNGIADYGIMMGDKKEWGKGYAKEASLVVLDHCFSRLNLRKITLAVVEDHKNAVELYKKIGFKIEGLLVKHSYFNGDFRNTYNMALFKDNFFKK